MVTVSHELPEQMLVKTNQKKPISSYQHVATEPEMHNQPKLNKLEVPKGFVTTSSKSAGNKFQTSERKAVFSELQYSKEFPVSYKDTY